MYMCVGVVEADDLRLLEDEDIVVLSRNFKKIQQRRFLEIFGMD